MAKTSRRVKRPSLDEMGLDLRGWRMQNGYTSKQLAEKLGVSNAATISSWENGKSSPRANMLRKLRDMMGVAAGDSTSGGRYGNMRAIEVAVDGLQLKADGAINLVDSNKGVSVNLKVDGTLRDYLGRLLGDEY